MAVYKFKMCVSYSDETVDLNDWGFGDSEWEDLTEEDQECVKDSLREQNIIEVEISHKIEEK